MNDIIDDFDGIDANDWLIIGPLSEEIANEKREQERAYRDTFGDDDDEIIFDKD